MIYSIPLFYFITSLPLNLRLSWFFNFLFSWHYYQFFITYLCRFSGCSLSNQVENWLHGHDKDFNKIVIPIPHQLRDKLQRKSRFIGEPWDCRLQIDDLWKLLSAVVATMAKSARSAVFNNKIKKWKNSLNLHSSIFNW